MSEGLQKSLIGKRRVGRIAATCSGGELAEAKNSKLEWNLFMVATSESLKAGKASKSPAAQPKPPPQEQPQPGWENRMNPKPLDDDPRYKGSGKLKDKVAL